MVSPLGGIPQLREAHFLNPVVSSIEGPRLKLPSLPFSSESEWPLKVSFIGCRNQQNKWKKWVENMESIHHSVWKKAGIYEAIMGSVYKVHLDEDLIFGLVERWCCETNTFIFPWGESTVTLEDMMILGGFSVLGDHVSLLLQSPELVEIEKNLEKARNDLIRLKADNHSKWLSFFMNSGKLFEHEAFLSLWLSKFVFPGNEYDKIGTHVFSIAVNLARGTRLAFAPAVLASIYRDLSLLKQSMIIASSNEPSSNGDSFNILEFTLWAPLFFVQVWAWERLVSLQPEQARNCNMVNGVRIGRWHNVKQSNVINVRMTIDSSAEIFLWRPYAFAVEGWLVPKFYKEKEEWAIVEGANLEQESESFIRCLRVSELVGLDCQEPYRPNRVARQFGYDQDFPKWIPRSPSSPELAWYNYSRPIENDLRLYYPSRLFDSDVTTQYLKWWRKEILFLADEVKGLLRRRRSKRKLKRLSNLCGSPVFAPKLKQVKIETDYDVCDVLSDPPKVDNYPDVPPGFPPKCVGENDKKHLSIEVSQTMACDIVTRGSVEKHTSEERIYTSTDYEHDRNEGNSGVCDVLPGLHTECQLKQVENYPDVPPGFASKCCGEYDKKNMSMGISQTMVCDIVPPGFVENHTAGERIYTSTVYEPDKNECNLYASPVFAPMLKQVKIETDCDVCDVLPGPPKVENYPDAPPGFPPKCDGENDKKNLSIGVSQMACDIVPPISVENQAAGERVIHTSTDYAHDRNEINSDIAPNLVINNHIRVERTSCDDLIMVLEVGLSRLERQAVLRKRC
ncbi:hypothetical protein RND71_037655 [Anisodus tanguticus]|uniref:Aminotransferase-like plant mobile domain-containing protein n=1 Tax=Anisodus tanguticus TaxID=243964 RepID=A0AAE1QZ57_9SOLA|nr:hypothetical protein RND71_037655 [Anisodus tanguticus]